MSGGIGRVPSSPAPIGPDDTTPTTTTTGPTDASTMTTTVSRTPTSARPTPPATPRASDIVPERILTKYGLDPNKLETESKYEGDRWNVGYYPYDGNIQYVAFGKYKDLFNRPDAGADAHGYWEAYSNPPSGLAPGSWIGDGTISESDFERATGIDVTGDRPIDNAAYKLMREAGAPMNATFALRDKDGKQLPVRDGDKLVPTILKDGKFVEVEVRNEGAYYAKGSNEQVSGDVVWRLKGRDGAIRGATTDKKEDRFALAGAKERTKFDFLDAAGEPIDYNPPSDRIVATYKKGDAWHAFVPKTGGQVEHLTLDRDGKRVTARETVTEARAAELRRGEEVIYRIQDRSGALKGDGKVGNSYDMGWWGKCHNVAAIGASSVKLPQQDVKIVTNRGWGEKVGLEWQEGSMHQVLIPKKNRSGVTTGYTLRSQGGVTGGTSTRDLTLEEGNRLAAEKKATPVIVTRTGGLKKAEVTTLGKSEVTAMVAHMGDGAVEYKGSVGARFYGVPDQITLKDGTRVNAYITEVKTQGGKTVEVGDKSGNEYSETDRSVLRGPGLNSTRVNNGWRTIGWSSQSFSELQASKQDKIKELKVVYPDGREEKIPADKVASLGWENKFDVTPTELWGMHKNVGAKGSSVIEQDPATHVWNYTIETMTTRPLKKEDIPSWMRDNIAKPGMMKGTTGDDGKYFFKTEVNGNEYYYWAKFDQQGNLSDYAYLTDDVPDFFWTQHVKDPISAKWEGEAQAPGADMRDIQKLYNASTGAYKKYELPGGYLSTSDLNRRPERP